MFIYSLKASTIRFFGIVCVALAALIALVAFVPTYVSGNGNADAPAAHLPEETSAPGGQTPGGAESVTYRYDKVRSADDAEAAGAGSVQIPEPVRHPLHVCRYQL